MGKETKTKTPSFNFYTADFLIGTQFMSDEQVGKYIRCLCYQHQHGRLTPAKIKTITKGDEEVIEKFERDDAGNYFNERLELEINKKAAYVESRRENASGKKYADAKQTEPEQTEYVGGFLLREMLTEYTTAFPRYIANDEFDMRALRRIAQMLSQGKPIEQNKEQIMVDWKTVIFGLLNNPNVKFYSGDGLNKVANNFQTIINKLSENGTTKTKQQRNVVDLAKRLLNQM